MNLHAIIINDSFEIIAILWHVIIIKCNYIVNILKIETIQSDIPTKLLEITFIKISDMADKPFQYSLSDIKLRMLLLLKDSENYDMEFYQVYFPSQK